MLEVLLCMLCLGEKIYNTVLASVWASVYYEYKCFFSPFCFLLANFRNGTVKFSSELHVYWILLNLQIQKFISVPTILCGITFILNFFWAFFQGVGFIDLVYVELEQKYCLISCWLYWCLLNRKLWKLIFIQIIFTYQYYFSIKSIVFVTERLLLHSVCSKYVFQPALQEYNIWNNLFFCSHGLD